MEYEQELLILIKQRLGIKTDEKDELLNKYIKGAYEYIVNSTGKTEFKNNENLVKVAITILAKEFYENSKDKKDSQVLVGILTQLEYSD